MSLFKAAGEANGMKPGDKVMVPCTVREVMLSQYGDKFLLLDTVPVMVGEDVTDDKGRVVKGKNLHSSEILVFPEQCQKAE